MDFREFNCRSALAGQEYRCRFVYLQTAISLRHSDTVDARFRVNGGTVDVAMPHTAWEAYRRLTGETMTDERASIAAANMLREALERGDAIELLDLNPAVAEVVARAKAVGPLAVYK